MVAVNMILKTELLSGTQVCHKIKIPLTNLFDGVHRNNEWSPLHTIHPFPKTVSLFLQRVLKNMTPPIIYKICP